MANSEVHKTVEAPTLRPSAEEWVDPLAYFRAIQPMVAHFGMARIIPPPDWHPPFALDSNLLHLRTTSQHISEHRATCDLRQACFLRRLKEFLDAVGQPLLKMPAFGGKDIDVYRLYHVVVEMGGYHQARASSATLAFI